MNYETVLAGEVSGAEKGIFALSASQALSPLPFVCRHLYRCPICHCKVHTLPHALHRRPHHCCHRVHSASVFGGFHA